MNIERKKLGLIGHFVCQGKIKLLTGMHIGAAADSVEIGGIDHPVIRHPISEEPFIPGSSLKGKMRHLLEKIQAAEDPKFEFNREVQKILLHVTDDIDDYVDKKGNEQKGALNDQVCRLFGSSGTSYDGKKEKKNNPNAEIDIKASSKGDNYPGRIIVRDAKLSDTDLLKKSPEDSLLITEAKMENAIDRITAAAVPRTIERVPAGAEFDFEIVYRAEAEFSNNSSEAHILNGETDKFRMDLKNIFTLFKSIEKDGLGGSISRGYGQVQFHLQNVFYENVAGEKEDLLKDELDAQKANFEEHKNKAEVEGEPPNYLYLKDYNQEEKINSIHF